MSPLSLVFIGPSWAITKICGQKVLVCQARGDQHVFPRLYAVQFKICDYEIDIYPNQETILAITDDRYAAKSATDIELKPGEELNDVDFTLDFGTLK